MEIKDLTYTAAKEELEKIVSAFEVGKLDVDELTKKVKRASELIAFCKGKLTKTDEELQKILDEMS